MCTLSVLEGTIFIGDIPFNLERLKGFEKNSPNSLLNVGNHPKGWNRLPVNNKFLLEDMGIDQIIIYIFAENRAEIVTDPSDYNI